MTIQEKLKPYGLTAVKENAVLKEIEGLSKTVLSNILLLNIYISFLHYKK